MDSRGQSRTRIFLFTHPRTASNLLTRIIETHPSVAVKTNAFRFGPEKMIARDTPQLDKFYKDFNTDEVFKDVTFQYSIDELERAIAEVEAQVTIPVHLPDPSLLRLPAEQGKIPVLKEHSYHMMVSESFKPHIDIDLKKGNRIRTFPPNPEPNAPPRPSPRHLHPYPVDPPPHSNASSLLRAFGQIGANPFDPDFPTDSSYKWQKQMYDCYKAWFKERDTRFPIVIDGDKLINDPQGQMEKLCNIVGLDSEGVKYTWESQELDTPVKALFIRTLCASTGVIQGDETAKPPVLEDEVKKWAEQWDEETAQEMKRRAELVLPDYEYLLDRSI
ncbi:hypothetical protein AAF712_007064 [Marasmius tenuissimus]|uniref:P-loop containing nucleoside triphosphate hydrolase protein n=1 Tax=Marasmius tenuissimus TaxID=585030 RepID=A0ABR3A057_9AGAR